jgi:2-methylcitrate dehydratase
MSAPISNVRFDPDKVLVDRADYVLSYRIDGTRALDTARNGLIETLGCGLEALSYPACTRLAGPVVPGTIVPDGATVPGTSFPFQLDPEQQQAILAVSPIRQSSRQCRSMNTLICM